MSKPSDFVLLGCVGAPYGIKGWMKITTYTDLPENIFDYSPWKVEIQGEWREVEVAEWRRHNKGVVARFADSEQRDDAQRLTGCKIGVAADQLPTLEEDEFYWRELIGMKVINVGGYDLGEVIDLMETGSNDVLVVKANVRDAFGKKERLIPMVEESVIKNVDRDIRTITVDWQPDF